jgi:uncharacterized membrane protein (DUF106 family)
LGIDTFRELLLGIDTFHIIIIIVLVLIPIFAWLLHWWDNR